MQNVGVRVSGGHLCEAEALFEPAGEYLRRDYKTYLIWLECRGRSLCLPESLPFTCGRARRCTV